MHTRALVTPLHTVVAGRARLRITGLYRSFALKHFLEAALVDGEIILGVSANILTGTILVRFSQHVELSAMIARVEVVIIRFVETPPALRTGSRALTRLAVEQPPWHEIDPSSVADTLSTSLLRGLATSDLTQRARRYGPNVLPTRSPRSSVLAFLDQFASLPVVLLLAAAGLSIATGGFGDAIAIGAVVLLNAVIGFFTERHAASRIAALLTSPRLIAAVCRDAHVQEIAAEQVVPGDLLLLRPGAPVVADARVVRAHALRIDESALTGESFPVEKTSSSLPPGTTPVADRINMVYRGTVVTAGDGVAVVVATGSSTEIGALQQLMFDEQEPVTPLQRQLAELGQQQVWVASLICGGVFAVGILRGHSVLEMLKSAVSLAVASIPEGLPAIATTALASGLNAMLQHQILVRRLSAVETLGAIQVACLDKTGTLTRNRMSVVAISAGTQMFDVVDGLVMNGDERPFDTHPDLRRLLEVCILCSETAPGYTSANGKSSTEAALLEMAVTSGADAGAVAAAYPLRAQRYRSDERLYMMTWHDSAAGTFIAIKGSPLEVLGLCSRRLQDGNVRDLSDADRDKIRATNERMADEAMRVLGFAYVETVNETTAFEGDAVWVGLIGMADPIRDGIAEVLRGLRHAGITPIMITGDQNETARAIARRLGLDTETEVFSRVNPSDKLRIVRRFQDSGHVVAMTGDGINDAPALKAAHVGITLGQSGTEVAQDVADIVLATDNIDSLLPAVREGRRVANNVHNAVDYITATNFSEILMVFGSIAIGLGQPLSTRQLLWINLLSDVFPELAFALEPGRGDLLDRPPRAADAQLIAPADRRRLGTQAGVISASALAAYGYGVGRYGIGARASTIGFLSLATAQLLHAFTIRSGTAILNGASRGRVPEAAGMGVGILATSQILPGVSEALGAIPLGVGDMLVCAGAASLSFCVNEFLKRVRRQAPPVLDSRTSAAAVSATA